MHWLHQLLREPHGIAHALLVLSLVAALGLFIGSFKVRGVGLGVAGVLFAGLLFGHFQFKIEPEVMEFAREFGLILFVYSIGIQVGPGFFASLRKQGLPLNLLAAGIVLAGALVTIVVYLAFMPRDQGPVAVGLFSGATTNTPSLAAAQQALKDMPGTDAERIKLPGLGYAVAYPFGILGIILTMLLVRWIFRISPRHEAQLLARLRDSDAETLHTVNLEVRNPNLDGLPLSRVPLLGDSGVVISRVLHHDQTHVPRGDTVLHTGDVLLAVGTRPKLDQVRLIVGAESTVDVRSTSPNITTRRIIVTRESALGKSVPELNLAQRYGVTITRINRGDVELSPTRDVNLVFGDTLVVVGEPAAVDRVALELGNSLKRLNHPQIVPVFIGIALGVIVGSWPIPLPGMPAPVKLGLAGGPLLVAILLSRLGNIRNVVWYMPLSANFMLREIGIVLFLASVGLRSGDRFVETLTQGNGLHWMLYGAAITFIPIFLVALIARIFLTLNYLSLCGLLAGSMTDPPALAFASSITGSDAPSVAYATVYPLVMLLRVLTAQAMVLFLLH